MTYDYFPLGIATGRAFCNRVIERQRLVKNLETHRNTLISSPRRYGKTSLVMHVLGKLEIPYIKVDLFVALDARAFEEQLLHGIQQLLSLISSKPEKIMLLVKDYFAHSKKKWTVGFKGIHLEMIPEKDSDPAINIMDALLALESVLAKKKQRGVIFIDEFQEIAALPSAKAMEGAIRHVAQQTKYLLFVFSGSNRHLLTHMFDDRSRPLYMLCERIIIDRIEEAHYIPFINKIAQKTWGNALSVETLQEIFALTECHPYYMNALCNALWSNHENRTTTPTAAHVDEQWKNFISTERARISHELTYLSLGQRKILTEIAFGQVTELTGKHFLQKVGLTGAGVMGALDALEQRDLIGKSIAGKYFVIDPLIRASLQFYYQDSYVR